MYKDITKNKIDKDILGLLDKFKKSEFSFNVNFELINKFPIMTREDLRNTKMEKGFFTCKSSGSTGEPVSIEKTYSDYVWYIATNIRELIWRKWDLSKNIAVIKPNGKIEDRNNWGVPNYILPNQGKMFAMNYQPISVIQKWLEEKNPHYIHCLPSIFKQLDLSKITNFIDCKSTGELGGTNYSSEECGTIALQCPDNPTVYHVMENQIIEVDNDGSVLISTLSNPYLRRYKHGDHVQLGYCHCGRTLQTITKIQGRVRNMFVMPNGDKKWPLIGSLKFNEFGIKKYKAIQTSLNELELQIICNPLNDRENELIQLVLKMLDTPINVKIKYVESFSNYKHEEFVCMI